VPDTEEIRTKARIVAAVKLKREVLEGVRQQQDIVSLVSRYARESLFRHDDREVAKLKKRIKTLMRRKYFPAAEHSGRKSAGPVLESLGRNPTPHLAGSAKRFLSSYKSANLKWFLAKMEVAGGELSGEIKAEFARSARDSIARKTMVERMTAAAREEMAELKIKRAALVKAQKALAEAESTGKISLIRQARKARTKARSAVNRVASPLARFENKVQAAARDTIRRQAQRSQLAMYRQTGYAMYSWVAVNGSMACPDCLDLHGETRSISAWRGMQPGDGHTRCGSSCMCELVPDEFTRDNEQVTGPINPYLDV